MRLSEPDPFVAPGQRQPKDPPREFPQFGEGQNTRDWDSDAIDEVIYNKINRFYDDRREQMKTNIEEKQKLIASMREVNSTLEE